MPRFAWYLCRRGVILLRLLYLSSNSLLYYFSIFRVVWYVVASFAGFLEVVSTSQQRQFSICIHNSFLALTRPETFSQLRSVAEKIWTCVSFHVCTTYWYHMGMGQSWVRYFKKSNRYCYFPQISNRYHFCYFSQKVFAIYHWFFATFNH